MRIGRAAGLCVGLTLSSGATLEAQTPECVPFFGNSANGCNVGHRWNAGIPSGGWALDERRKTRDRLSVGERPQPTTDFENIDATDGKFFAGLGIRLGL